MNKIRGFSLIECLISIVLLSICFAILSVAMLGGTVKIVRAANMRDANIAMNNLQQMAYAGTEIPDEYRINNITVKKIDRYLVAFVHRDYLPYLEEISFIQPSVVPPSLLNEEGDIYLSDKALYRVISADGSFRLDRSTDPRDIGNGFHVLRPLDYRILRYRELEFIGSY